MAGIVRDPTAERREQMTPEHGSDAGQNDVQLPQYAQHSRRVDFRSCQHQRGQQTQEIHGHITATASAFHGGRPEPVQSVVPIVYLTIVNLVVRVDTQQPAVPESKPQLPRHTK